MVRKYLSERVFALFSWITSSSLHHGRAENGRKRVDPELAH